MEKLATVDNNQKIIFGRKELSEAIKERRRIARQVRLEKILQVPRLQKICQWVVGRWQKPTQTGVPIFELSVDEIKEILASAKPHCVFPLDTGSHIPQLLP